MKNYICKYNNFKSMIATQQIKSTTQKPIPFANFEIINVLKWNNSKWKRLSPYLLKTDGNEINKNEGNILFENFYQGCKVYDIVYSNKVYASQFHNGNPKYLWWDYQTINPNGDIILQKNKEPNIKNMNIDLYLQWRNSLWNCPNPIRYPNKKWNTKHTKFSCIVDENNKPILQMDYLTARREIYIKEYIRLIKQLPEYLELLEMLKCGKNILICEIDVPANGKHGFFGNDCNENNICFMSLQKLNLLLNDPNEAFGHGLCLAYSLLLDLETENDILQNNIIENDIIEK